jgi:TolB-like protein/Tfp pilus assembly protein PilF
MNFLEELKRRNVFRVAAAYVVVAWLVVQVAETILPIFEVPDVFLRGVILVLVLGFPLALFFAWAFELTPEGVKREKDVDREHSGTSGAGRKLDRAIIVVLLLAVGYFAVDKFLSTAGEVSDNPASAEAGIKMESSEVGRGAQPAENALAVMAFDDMSPENDQEYLADGLAEELLNLLARIPELRLTSRSSSFAYKDRDVSLRTVAEELGVTYILEGSVRKAGDQVRIAAQLIDARTDTQVWSQTYDRELKDIFDIQDDIAASVVDELRVTLLDEVPTADQVEPEAYENYLRGKYLVNLGNIQSQKQARDYFEAALAIDPDYVEARLGIAVTLMNQTAFGERSREEALPLVRSRIESILSSHPDHAMANSLQGWLLLNLENDWVGAAEYFEKSVEAAPANPSILTNASVMLNVLGRTEQAIGLYEYVIGLDPLNQQTMQNLASAYMDARRFDEAISMLQQVVQMNSNAFLAHALLGRAWLQKGDPERAAEAFRQELSEVERELGLAMVAHAEGRAEAFKTQSEEWLQRWGEAYPAKAAKLLSFAGREKRAVDWLAEISLGSFNESLWQPEYDPIRDEPGWQALLERLGLTREQREKVEFSIEVPGVND